jgi:hypothetical protein
MTLKFSNTKQLVERALELDYFQDPDPAIPYVWKPSKADNPLVVVVGENAGGKSFFRRCVNAVCGDKTNKVECIPISMEGRRQVAYNIGLSFVYGSEDWEATGVNSISTVLTGISTCRNRTSAHVIIWDEPDIGLSEGNAASVGKAIADFTREPPTHTKASIVITHRKALVEQLVPIQPHYLFLGDENAPETLAGWLAAPPIVRPLEEVKERSRKRFLAIQKILDEVKRKKDR